MSEMIETNDEARLELANKLVGKFGEDISTYPESLNELKLIAAGNPDLEPDVVHNDDDAEPTTFAEHLSHIIFTAVDTNRITIEEINAALGD